MFKRYNQYKDRICLIEGSKQLTFEALEQLIDEFVETYLCSDSRKLVFIEVSNNITSVVAYLACLRNSHVVMLLNPESHEQNTLLADKYEANLFLNTVSHQVNLISQSTYCHQFHDELALLLGTSGSTGSPKLVKLSRQNIMANTRAIIEYLALTPSDRAITSLKFSYSYGLSVINSHLEAGASVVLTDHGTLSDAFWKQVKSFQVTSFSGVPYHFESFDEQGLDLAEYPSLRYFTQAGGKLSARLVGKFATLCNKHNKQFFVMYGQTEASPRISYLPPELACEYPQAIGRAVPGGELYLLDDSGHLINETGIEGELVYKGPNVMMGYAAIPEELATCNDTDYLKTGDLAKKVCGDIFEITGRKSRFAKPLGIRVNLEDVQLLLKNNGVNCAVTSNKSEMILIGYLPSPEATNKAIIKLIQGHIKIPVTSIVAKQLVDIPRLPNGKVNFVKLREDILNVNLKDVTKLFWGHFSQALSHQLGLAKQNWQSVESIFRFHFPAAEFNQSASFYELGGDSLTFMKVLVDIEEYLGCSVPKDWHVMSIKELEECHYESAL